MSVDATDPPQGAPPPAPRPGVCPWTLDWFLGPGGGRLRWGYVSCDMPCRGTLLLFMGRTEYLEKYDEMVREWAGRGFQVLALEWRGQGLSGRFLDNPMKCHIDDYAVFYLDFGAWYEAEVRPRVVGPLVLFAHSMGGLIGLRVLADQPGRFTAAVLTVPMVAINTAPWPVFVARLLARAACAVGRGGSYAFGQGDYDTATDGVFAGNPLSGDPERFCRIHDGFRRDPRLRLGGVTFGWLAASFRAQAALVRPDVLRGIATPVLLLTAGRDPLVPPEAQRRLGRLLPACVMRDYPEARHDPFSEQDTIRTCVWADIDVFLNQTLPDIRLYPE